MGITYTHLYTGSFICLVTFFVSLIVFGGPEALFCIYSPLPPLRDSLH